MLILQDAEELSMLVDGTTFGQKTMQSRKNFRMQIGTVPRASHGISSQTNTLREHILIYMDSGLTVTTYSLEHFLMACR